MFLLQENIILQERQQNQLLQRFEMHPSQKTDGQSKPAGHK